MCIFNTYVKIIISEKKVFIIDDTFIRIWIDKIFILRYPVIQLHDFSKKKNEKIKYLKIEKKNLIIGIGRLTKQKNFVFLIRAFKKKFIKYPNYHLILLGEVEQKE